ncbi:MAG: hypothetical protein F6K56_36730 [Moorea sp. SIO3G5]|nr:hypothetical protein [Moorena sp. SIO3G5]
MVSICATRTLLEVQSAVSRQRSVVSGQWSAISLFYSKAIRCSLANA